MPRAGVVMPRIRSVALKLWKIYLLFSAICFVALLLAGMSLFDAVNMTFSIIATGGYTPNTGVADIYANNGYIRFILVTFMILAGGNFTVYYNVFQQGLQSVWQDFEYRMYIFILAIGATFVVLSLCFQSDLPVPSCSYLCRRVQVYLWEIMINGHLWVK